MPKLSSRLRLLFNGDGDVSKLPRKMPGSSDEVALAGGDEAATTFARSKSLSKGAARVKGANRRASRELPGSAHAVALAGDSDPSVSAASRLPQATKDVADFTTAKSESLRPKSPISSKVAVAATPSATSCNKHTQLNIENPESAGTPRVSSECLVTEVEIVVTGASEKSRAQGKGNLMNAAQPKPTAGGVTRGPSRGREASAGARSRSGSRPPSATADGGDDDDDDDDLVRELAAHFYRLTIAREKPFREEKATRTRVLDSKPQGPNTDSGTGDDEDHHRRRRGGLEALEDEDDLLNEDEDSRSYGSGGGLPAHLLDEDKPFQCRICRSAFKFKRSLTRHIKSSHEGGFGTCRVCTDVKFSQKVSYEKHLQKSQKHLRKLWEAIARRDSSRLKSEFLVAIESDPERVKFDRTKLVAALRELGLDHVEGVDKKVAAVAKDRKARRAEMGVLRQCPMCNIVFESNRQFIRHCASHEKVFEREANPGLSNALRAARDRDRNRSRRNRSRSPIRRKPSADSCGGSSSTMSSYSRSVSSEPPSHLSHGSNGGGMRGDSTASERTQTPDPSPRAPIHSPTNSYSSASPLYNTNSSSSFMSQNSTSHAHTLGQDQLIPQFLQPHTASGLSGSMSMDTTPTSSTTLNPLPPSSSSFGAYPSLSSGSYVPPLSPGLSQNAVRHSLGPMVPSPQPQPQPHADASMAALANVGGGLTAKDLMPLIGMDASAAAQYLANVTSTTASNAASAAANASLPPPLSRVQPPPSIAAAAASSSSSSSIVHQSLPPLLPPPQHRWSMSSYGGPLQGSPLSTSTSAATLPMVDATPDYMGAASLPALDVTMDTGGGLAPQTPSSATGLCQPPPPVSSAFNLAMENDVAALLSSFNEDELFADPVPGDVLDGGSAAGTGVSSSTPLASGVGASSTLMGDDILSSTGSSSKFDIAELELSDRYFTSSSLYHAGSSPSLFRANSSTPRATNIEMLAQAAAHSRARSHIHAAGSSSAGSTRSSGKDCTLESRRLREAERHRASAPSLSPPRSTKKEK